MSAASGNGASEPVSSGNGAHEPLSFGNGAGPAAADLAASAPPMRPEVAVGAAFAGGFLLAVLLRRVRS